MQSELGSVPEPKKEPEPEEMEIAELVRATVERCKRMGLWDTRNAVCIL